MFQRIRTARHCRTDCHRVNSMPYAEEFDLAFRRICDTPWAEAPPVARAIRQLDFAHRFAGARSDRATEWQPLILQASRIVAEAVGTHAESELSGATEKAEHIMAPIGLEAKTYTIHACGHAHIDMNWMWPWQDTISICHDTFTTMDRLMEEFPDFRFCQSQAAIYAAMEEHCPELFERIRERIRDGHWECTATSWVEGDRNLVSGESLSRHLLYSRRYLNEKLGIPVDAIKIDWACDTFGHAHTVPAILSRGGITRYYRHRTGPDKWLLWWKAPDGSKLLTFYDKATYVHAFDHRLTEHFIDYISETGLKDFLWVYGVGDHGGGPTRRDLRLARELAALPIYPSVRLSTLDEYFSSIEPVAARIPVHDDELNFVFEGCYTSQATIKLGNRMCENVLPEAETLAVIAGAISGMPYPRESLEKAWRIVLFNQFHDILPGSGTADTVHHANGMYQECLAGANAVRTRALRRIAAAADTAEAFGLTPPPRGEGAGLGEGLGAGVGDNSLPGGLSAYAAGTIGPEPILVFNADCTPRSGLACAKVWDKNWPDDRIVAVDDRGNRAPAQVLESGSYWGHHYQTVLFPVRDIPAVGYRVVVLDRVAEHVAPDTAAEITQDCCLENEHLLAEVDAASGAVSRLVLKASGRNLIPEGKLLGVLEGVQEAPNNMTAWKISQIMRLEPLEQGAVTMVAQRGPNRVAVRTKRKWRDTSIETEIGLDAGSPMLDFTVTVDWLERGTPETGVPSLRVAFPTSLEGTRARYEIPFGSISRPTDGHEVPALRWADVAGALEGAPHGITLLNDSKYGHSADGSTLRLTLLRGSYSPDPLPDLGRHTIRFSVAPYAGIRAVSEAMSLGSGFNLPLTTTSTDVHKGSLPPSAGFAEVLTTNVRLAALKATEDGNGIIVRLYEADGKDTEARVVLRSVASPNSRAMEVDLMERPLDGSRATMDGDTLVVPMRAYGIASIRVG